MTGRAHTREAGSTRREPVAGSTGASAPATSFLWPLIGVVLFLGYWGVVKANLFEQLAYTSDLFSTIQISRSWIDGRPLLSENAFGRFVDQHNVYALLALGPATALFGAYGLFVPYLLMLATASGALFGLVRNGRARLLLSALVLGPTGFWIWDNPVYGFHSEVFLLPVGLLYASTLATRSRLRWPLLAALFVIHEQGPLVGLGVHIAFAMSASSGGYREATLTVARLVAGYACLFAAGLLILYLNSEGQSRVGQALGGLGRTLTDSLALESLLRDLVSWAALILPLLVVTILCDKRPRTPVGFVLAVGPLLGMAIVGRSLYTDSGLGLTWTPRFVGAWTVGMAWVIYALRHVQWVPGPLYGSKREFRTRCVATQLGEPRVASVSVPYSGPSRAQRGQRYWEPAKGLRGDIKGRSPLAGSQRQWVGSLAAVCVLLGYQAWVLDNVRDYDFRSRFTAVRGTNLPASRFTGTELRAMDCISANLGRGVHIASTGDLFGKFHMNSIVWPDRPASAWRPPQVIVCDTAGRTLYGFAECNALIDNREHFTETRIEGLRIAHDAETGRAIEGCLQP
jgi:hypothetical protein